MYSKNKLYSFIVFTCLVGILAYRCSGALYVPTALDAERENIILDSLILGRELYIRNCGSCHTLYLPDRYSKTEWKAIVKRMQKPAKINDVQANAIYLYLTARAKKIESKN
ncbi:MAG: cytochrome c [Bacteroidales bacterium]|nr:cytochrome c [Bacteroidales bacterium]